MQLEVGACMGAFASCIPDALHIDLALTQRILQANPLAIGTAAVSLDGLCAGERGRTKQAAAEPGALLVSPIHQANGDRRLAVVVLCQTTQHLEAGQNAERAVEPTPVGD